MEPYRPYADKLVVQLIAEEGIAEELTPAIKKKLLVLPAMDITMQGETSPLMIAMQRTTASLAKCFLGETRKIVYPTLD
jgi:CRISP-associated protein Cas1